MKAAIIGGGLIGAGWAARFLLNGWNVAVFEPNEDAKVRLRLVIERARETLPLLYDTALPVEGELRFVSLQEAIEGANWVQESAPERIEVKRQLFADIHMVDPAAIIGSSTSALKPTDLQAGAARPELIVVVHPFNPVYLLPLVEVVGSSLTAPRTVKKATEIVSSLGMKPLVVRREIDGFIANRLQEAIWREALWLINDGIATTSEVDEAICLSFGLRLAQMGQFEISRIAGGDGGMAHLLWQFGPYLKEPLSRLTDVPELGAELINKISQQSDEQTGARSIAELEKKRDCALVALICALKRENVAAGAVVSSHEATLKLR